MAKIAYTNYHNLIIVPILVTFTLKINFISKYVCVDMEVFLLWLDGVLLMAPFIGDFVKLMPNSALHPAFPL